MAEDNILDIITDLEIDEDSTSEEGGNSAPTAPTTFPETTTEKGIVRDEKGRFVKGTKPASPGRPKRLKQLDKFIRENTGQDADKLMEKLLEIAMYDPNQLEDRLDKKTGKVEQKKKTWHYYTAGHQMEALRLFLTYYLGPPAQNIEINKNVDIRIEKRVADFTKLINENYEKLKVIQGGKGDGGNE